MSSEEVFRHSQTIRVGPHPRECRLHGFLHDLTDLAGHGESAFALHGIGFDKQYIASRGSPRKTHGNSGTFRPLGNFALAADLDSTQELLNDLFADDKLLRFPFRQPARLLAADRSDGAFQAAYARFPRVVPDHVSDPLFGKFNLLARNAVLVDLPGNQVPEGNVNFLFFGIAL